MGRKAEGRGRRRDAVGRILAVGNGAAAAAGTRSPKRPGRHTRRHRAKSRKSGAVSGSTHVSNDTNGSNPPRPSDSAHPPGSSRQGSALARASSTPTEMPTWSGISIIVFHCLEGPSVAFV